MTACEVLKGKSSTASSESNKDTKKKPVLVPSKIPGAKKNHGSDDKQMN